MHRFTESGLALLKHFEKCRLTAYRDMGKRGGTWTIGYGHTGKEVTEGLVIGYSRAEELLLMDLLWARNGAEHVIKRSVAAFNDNQFSALTCLLYNLGLTHYMGSRLDLLLTAGQFGLAIHEWAGFVHTTIERPDGTKEKVIAPGLPERRRAEIALFLTPLTP